MNDPMDTLAKDGFDEFFQAPDFAAAVRDLNNHYKEFGFSDDLDDRSRLEEFRYITEQFRKFVFKKQGELIGLWGNKQKLLDKIEDIISKQQELETERKKFVYNYIRDEWLRHLHGFVKMILDDEEDDDDRYR